MRMLTLCTIFAATTVAGCGAEPAVVTASQGAALGAATTCDGTFLPMNRPDPLACCRDGDEEWFIFGGTPSRLVRRLHGAACTFDGVTGGCIGLECLYGPCGSTAA